MLEQTLPHLFGSCPRLRGVEIQRENRTTRWRSEPGTELREHNGVWINEVAVFSVDEDDERNVWRVIRAEIAPDARGGLLVALRRSGETWEVSKPGRVPSVFRQLPVLGGPALSTWVIIDGEFDLDQERSSVHVMGEYGRPLSDAFAALEGLALLATREGWANGYRVAQLAVPTEDLGEAAMKVWHGVLSSTAGTLAQRPLVTTIRAGMLPAVQTDGYDHWVDFVPRAPLGLSQAELWDLASKCMGADPPVKSESEGWSEIARGWEALGVPILWTDLEKIGKVASDEVDTVADLAVEGEPYPWLARYLDAVGRTWQATDGITKSHVKHLLPDQHGKLHDFGQLQIDVNVSDQVKEIADNVGLDIRAQLLDKHVVQALTEGRLEAGKYAIREASLGEMTEDDAVRDLVGHISEALPDGKVVSEENQNAATASVALLEHLWSSQGKEAREVAWEVPLLAADRRAYRAGPQRLMVPPVPAWPEAAQPFANAYPEGRVLDDRYSDTEGCKNVLKALASWGIAHDGLLTKSRPADLRERGLRAIAADAAEVEDARLRGEDLAALTQALTQIALLQPEVIEHSKQSREEAQALLGLLVCYVAPNDKSWLKPVKTTIRTHEGHKQEAHLTLSLWLADLKSKPWIPVEGEQITHYVPSPELLRNLIKPEWLEGNPLGVDLLTHHFDMDELEVRLLAAAGDEETRQQVRDDLARIVKVAGGDPQLIKNLADKAAKIKVNVGRMRDLGLAVQDRVKLALEKRGLKVEFIDRGYDFRVTDDRGNTFDVTEARVREEDNEDPSATFEFGSYKVEVKTTTTGEARLTPLQAATAVKDPKFVLCVVDLRNFDGDVHEVDWNTMDVSAYCRFVYGRSLPIDETLTFVQKAQGSGVPIRNETALRYAVRPGLWQTGLNLDQWVQDVVAR